MIRRSAAALGLLLVLAPAARATISQTPDVTDVHFKSVLRRVVPVVAGITWKVLDLNDELTLTNHSHATVTIYAYPNSPKTVSYNGGPYARILGDGTVEVNENSPAYYLNRSFFATGTVPASASATASPDWVTLARNGVYTWHDHRIHYTSFARPEQVKDPHRTTFIEDWYVPIQVGAKRGYLYGQLYWIGEKSFSFPTAAVIAFVVIAAGGAALVITIRRRRRPIDANEAW